MENYSISSDCIFEPAQRPHKVCQDYSICGKDPFPFLIISDGCSSSENTDIGSRIISHVAKANLDIIHENSANFSKQVICKSFGSILDLHLDPSCLDCTLIVAYIINNEAVIMMYGDGHIFITNKEGKVRFHKKIYYNGNAPYYLSYKLDFYKDKIYKEYNKSGIIGKVEIDTPFESNDKFLYDIKVDSENKSYQSLDDTEFLIITSDGIESFFNYRTNEKIPEDGIINEISSFKNKKGSFVKRRINRMLSDLKEEDIYNSDDISVAAFHIEKENEI
jgi:hypothetical protein